MSEVKLTSCGSQTAGFVVAGADHHALGIVLFEKIEDSLNCSVVGQDLMHLSSRVICVSGMVDPAAFNHDEEALVAVLSGGSESVEGSSSHLGQRRVNIINESAVNLKRNVCGREQAQKWQLYSVARLQGVEIITSGNVVPAILLGLLQEIFVVGSAATFSGVGQEVASSSTENEIDSSPERTIADELICDLVFHLASSCVTGKASGSGIGDASGDDQTGGVAGSLGSLHDRATRSEVGKDGDGAIVALHAAAERGGSSGTVGDERRATPGAALANEMIIENQCVTVR